MSHFTVMVLSENEDVNLDKVLAPYCEDTDCVPAEYLTFIGSKTVYDKHFKLEYDTYEDFLKDIEKIAEEFGLVYSKKNEDYGFYTNTNSHWDWYEEGGRWSGAFFKSKITGKPVDEGYINELEQIHPDEQFCTYAVITPDGKWHALGEMGWFAVSSNENPRWTKDFEKKYMKPARKNGWYLTIVDCHI